MSHTKIKTRLHSSRMRTASLLPVSPSMHCTGGGGSGPEGSLPLVPGGGVPASGPGVGVCIPACNGADPPPREQNS